MNVCLDRKLNNGKSILRDKQNMIREFHAGRRKLAKETFHPHKFSLENNIPKIYNIIIREYFMI